MEKNKIFSYCIFLGIAFYLLWHFVFLDKFLMVNLDDGCMMEPAWQFLTKGSFSSPQFEGIYGLEKIDIYHGRLHMFFQLPFLKLFGPGPNQVRIVSLVSSFLVLVVTFLIGKKIYGLTTAFAGVLLLSVSGLFILCSHSARQEMLLTLFIALSIYLYIIAEEKKNSFLFFTSGLISALSLDVHLNGIILVLTLGLLFFICHKFKFLFTRHFWLWFIGVMAGILWWIAFHILPDPQIFLTQFKGIVLGSFTPPILRTFDFFTLVSKEVYRYYEWFWMTTWHRNMFELFVIIVAVSFSFMKRTKSRNETIVNTLIVSFVILFLLIIPNKTSWYLVYLYPFLSLLIANFCKEIKIRRIGKVLFLGMIVFYLTQITVWSLKHRNADYNSYINRIKEHIPEGSSLLADESYWPGFIKYTQGRFKANNFAHYEKFYKIDWGEYLRLKNMDYIIVNENFKEKEFLSNNYVLVGVVKDKVYGGQGHITGEEFKTFIYRRK